MDPALLGAVVTAASVIAAAAITRGVSLGRKRKQSQVTVQKVLDTDDDGEALSIARENSDERSKIVLGLLEREIGKRANEIRRRSDCEERLAQEKKERKAEAAGFRRDLAELRTELQEVRRERQ